MPNSSPVQETPPHQEQGLKDFRWFPLIFSALVGGPSILSIVQQVFVEHQLIGLLQWIVDGYNDLMSLLGVVLEPLFAPFIRRLNDQNDWDLHLYPHWRPLFALSMVLVMSLVRSERQAGKAGSGYLVLLAFGFPALIGSLMAGLCPISGGWWVQGVSSLLAFGLIGGFVTMVAFGPDKWIAGCGVVTVLLFTAGVGLSFIPGLQRGAGMFALGICIALLGLRFWVAGRSEEDATFTRFGLTILGGFTCAGAILLADWIVKILS